MSTGLALPASTIPANPPETLTIEPWPDGVIDALGHDPRSHYVEQTGSDHECERGECVAIKPDSPSSTAGFAPTSGHSPGSDSKPNVAVRIMVRPLIDPVVDPLGFPVGSAYVEGLWLGILGPSATWALRRLGATVTAHREGVAVDLAELGASIGLGSGVSPNSSIVRTVKRLVSFSVAAWQGNDLLVRRVVAPLTMRQLGRLSPSLVALHHRMVDSRRVSSDKAV